MLNRLKGLLSGKVETEPEDYYEYCPNCDANLTLQKGYDNELPYWVCKGCGEMLINPDVDAENEIAWFCDKCGKMLNTQPGFSEDCGEWICCECGFVNPIGESQIFLSKDEYLSYARDLYKGLSDSAVLVLSEYEEERSISGRDNVFLVRNRESGQRYVKKVLTAYDRSVYDFLMENPVDHMPGIVSVFEGDNSLIVIEEYIEGRTVAELIGEEPMEERRAIAIARDVCRILTNLHALTPPMIHRDIKPSNIMIADTGETYLLDVNAARWFDPRKNDDTVYMGTRSYAAPEQAGFGLRSSSGKTDIYALGVTLNVMLTGCFPKEHRVDGGKWEIIERCISMDPDKRYSSAELMKVLEEETL